MMASLFKVALRQARQKSQTSWPPPSYLRNDLNDLDPSELNDLTLHPRTQTPSCPSHIPTFPTGDQVRPRWHRQVISSGSQVLLSRQATLDAVRYSNACNPIVRAVANSYLIVAQRLAPTQLQRAQRDYQLELQQRSDRRIQPSFQDLVPDLQH